MIEIIPNFHPAIVHFPIAFGTAAVAFTSVGILFSNWTYAAQCLRTGRWMLWGAAVLGIIAATFGWFAFNSVAHDEVSHAAMIVHRNWALGTVTALFILAVWDVLRGRTVKMPTYGFLVFLIAAWLLVMSTAWHGAELVYRHGLGVISLPDVGAEQDAEIHDGSGHEHQHTH
ncbi:DUF2231 domain-containing protein [Ferrigenium sp. UT4]